MKNILEVEDLGIMIDGEKIVKDISFFVHDQHITCIVGESGSGKSVTMSAVLGLLPKVACKTKESKIMFHGDSMFCIYQDPMNSLNSSVKVGKQLYQMAKGYKKMTRAEFDQQMGIILERIKFEDPMRTLNKYPFELSGGMLQRLMIACAILVTPSLIIADEPTTALDVTIQEQILNLIAELNEKLGMSVLFITHDLGAMAQLCHSVRVMYLGNLVEEAETDELFEHPMHPYTQGLLNCIPRLDSTRGEPLHVISGVVPPLSNVPEGCHFCTRCPYADEHCRTQVPPSVEVRPGHKVKCWKYVSGKEDK